MTFDGRQPLLEDDLWLKMTFDGGQPFIGRWSLIEDDLLWKPNFDGTTFSESQFLIGDYNFVMTKRKDQKIICSKIPLLLLLLEF